MVVSILSQMENSWINLAFDEALASVGVSFPNPSVGAVLVKDGIVVGRGHTQVVGGPHAEVMALRDAGPLAKGADLWVTLEPCCHFGRTPPCTQAIVASGVSRVFYAHSDPNPVVCGRSGGILKEAGIESSFVEPSSDFERFYEAYDYFVQNKRTFVELKIAESADGFIAKEDRTSVRITQKEANLWTAKWRRSAEMILVGGGTALADNPHLTVRGVNGNSPRKIVFAGSRILPPSLNLFLEQTSPSAIVYSRVPQPQLEKIAEVHLFKTETFEANWMQVLDELSAKGVHRLAVEPGLELSQKIMKSGLWNRLYVLHSKNKMGKGLSWHTEKDPNLQVLSELGEDRLTSALNK